MRIIRIYQRDIRAGDGLYDTEVTNWEKGINPITI